MARVTFKFFTSSCLHVRTPLPLSPAYLLYYCLPPSLNLRILLLLILLVFSSPSLVIGLSLAFPSSPPPVHYVIPANPHLPLGRAPIGRGWGFEDGCDCNMWHLSVKWWCQRLQSWILLLTLRLDPFSSTQRPPQSTSGAWSLALFFFLLKARSFHQRSTTSCRWLWGGETWRLTHKKTNQDDPRWRWDFYNSDITDNGNSSSSSE